ncbi:hypothetical protein DBT_1591 [Dissulfuribacter thermophilus]|uniref:Uncharacterized protein n=1 Tax=Dissulfuribacter thermophilus TaxID=1156395 RepID=A0A1B9F5L6_9BACT|nr:hypothetical protein [Dissulfuribacter thermophilus]OCC15105.1 hypothetical protein DBT_1591 [Dissulfuribacter thermophilus]
MPKIEAKEEPINVHVPISTARRMKREKMEKGEENSRFKIQDFRTDPSWPQGFGVGSACFYLLPSTLCKEREVRIVHGKSLYL